MSAAVFAAVATLMTPLDSGSFEAVFEAGFRERAAIGGSWQSKTSSIGQMGPMRCPRATSVVREAATGAAHR